MDDPSPTHDGRAESDLLLAELRAINDEVEAGALEMERLSGSATHPEVSALSNARLRFSRALRRHLQHVDGVLLAHLHASTDADARPAIDAYRQLLYDYHEAAAYHVARWPSTSVTADWEGYRQSVADMLARLRQRIEVERRDIDPLLAVPDRR